MGAGEGRAHLSAWDYNMAVPCDQPGGLLGWGGGSAGKLLCLSSVGLASRVSLTSSLSSLLSKISDCTGVLKLPTTCGPPDLPASCPFVSVFSEAT